MLPSHFSEWSPLNLACLGAGRKQAAERFICEAEVYQWNITIWGREKEGEWNSTYGKQQEIINNSWESTVSEEVQLAGALGEKVELENGKVWHPPQIRLWENQHELNSLWLLAPCFTSSVSFSKNTDAFCFDTLQVPGLIENHAAAIQSITSQFFLILSLNNTHSSLRKKAGVLLLKRWPGTQLKVQSSASLQLCNP